MSEHRILIDLFIHLFIWSGEEEYSKPTGELLFSFKTASLILFIYVYIYSLFILHHLVNVTIDYNPYLLSGLKPKCLRVYYFLPPPQIKYSEPSSLKYQNSITPPPPTHTHIRTHKIPNELIRRSKPFTNHFIMATNFGHNVDFKISLKRKCGFPQVCLIKSSLLKMTIFLVKLYILYLL